MNRNTLIPRWWERICNSIAEEKETIRFCLTVVFVWGLIAHAYGFVHRNLSHDGLNVFVAESWETVWKIQLGRYFVPLYRAIFRGPIMLPWLIGLWGLLWTSFAAYMVIRVLEVRSRFQTVLICGIMVTNISFISQIATYLYEFDFNAFAIMMAAAAVYLWRRRPGAVSALLGGVCVMVSIGIYQSFVAVTVTLIIWVSIMELLREKPVKQVFVSGLWGIATVVMGGIFYLLLSKGIHAVTGIPMEARTDALQIAEGGSLISEYARLILPAIVDLGGNIVHQAYRRVPQMIAIGCVCALIGVGAVILFVRKKFTWDRLLLIGVLCLALPFGMNCVYFLTKGEGMHDLTTYATWFFYIIVLQMAFWVFESWEKPAALPGITAVAASFLVMWVLLQNVTLSNTAYVKKKMDVDATFSTMSRVVAMLEQREDYVVGETKIAMIGAPATVAHRPAFDRVRTITGVEVDFGISTDWLNWNYNAYDVYFRYVMNYPVNLCGAEEREEKVMSSPVVQQMPPYPSPGCMQMVDDILVIRLS